MILKGLTELLYIQSLTFCLGQDNCYNCKFYNEIDEVYLNCSLFNGRFAFLGYDSFISVQIAESYHAMFGEMGCDDHCVFKHKNRYMDECYFTDITNRIGKCVKNV